MRLRLRLLALGAAVLTLTGCAELFWSDNARTSGTSTAAVDYLYPKGAKFEPMHEGVPEIKLPARVGLVFVPSSRDPAGLNAADRETLLRRIGSQFSNRDFIERIEIIPDSYLRPGGGFANLEQTARLYGVNVVALVSYDQDIHTNERAASILYWTIVGAYTIPATKNQVTTLVETAVFDVASHTLLLRAPGQDQRNAGSTMINGSDVRDRLGRAGFQAAVDNMIPNLDAAITSFSQRVKEEGQVKLVDRKSGGSWRGGGGGSTSLWELALLMMAVVLVARRRAARF
jgi:rhombotail lipoprotein